MQNWEEVQLAVAALRQRLGAALPSRPDAAIILGTGLSGLVERMEDTVSVPYADLPGFPVSTVASHAGAFVLGRLGGRTVLEQYIKGREIQVAVLNDKPLPSIEIIPQADFYDYENKYQPGAALEVCPAQIPAEWEEEVGKAAVTVFQALGLAVYARADFIVTTEGEAYFLEINTLPGMTPTSLVPQEAAAVGMDYPALCETIVESSLKARKEGA